MTPLPIFCTYKISLTVFFHHNPLNIKFEISHTSAKYRLLGTTHDLQNVTFPLKINNAIGN